jgi:hypothetical protein
MNIPKSYTVFRALMGTLVLVIGLAIVAVLTPLVIQFIQG